MLFRSVLNRANYHSRRICLKGLNPDTTYQLEGTEETYTGDVLMKAGLNIANLWGDFKGELIHLVACN